MTISTQTTEITCASAVRAAQINANLPRPDLLAANGTVESAPPAHGSRMGAVGVVILLLTAVIAIALAVSVVGIVSGGR